MQYYDNYVQRKRRRPQLDTAPRAVASPSDNPAAPMVHAESNRREWIKLGGVYLVIAVCATIMSYVLGFDLQIWLEWFMGGFFVIFASFKLIGYETFVMLFPQYDPIAARSKIYTMVYPFIELFLGFLYVANLLPIFRDLVTLFIFSIGAWGVLQYTKRSQGEAIHCACLGNVIKLPLSTVTLIEDVLMAALSVIMIIGYFVF